MSLDIAIIVACSISTSYCYLFALQRGSASWVTTYISTYPLIALMLFVGTGHNRLNIRTLVGTFLVVAGLMVMQMTPPSVSRSVNFIARG